VSFITSPNPSSITQNYALIRVTSISLSQLLSNVPLVAL
jgi:hypothetical protein